MGGDGSRGAGGSRGSGGSSSGSGSRVVVVVEVVATR